MRDVPEICTRSEQLIEGKDRTRVEDRLLTIGKMWKEKKERAALENFETTSG